LSHTVSPFVLSILEIGFENYFLGLASNHDPPDLCLVSSQDYRREPLASNQT
jgi:hypothetical protein